MTHMGHRDRRKGKKKWRQSRKKGENRREEERLEKRKNEPWMLKNELDMSKM